jgi:hypothetical protein
MRNALRCTRFYTVESRGWLAIDSRRREILDGRGEIEKVVEVLERLVED